MDVHAGASVGLAAGIRGAPLVKTFEATLVERTGYLYRRLLLLQRLFQASCDSDCAEWLEAGDEASNLALCLSIREVLDELAEQARVLTKLPLPISDWRPGDGPDDERWRALTEVERREVLSLVLGYEALIAWSEGLLCRDVDHDERPEGDRGASIQDRPPHRSLGASARLKDERARLARFRQEMAFLDRRRIPDAE